MRGISRALRWRTLRCSMPGWRNADRASAAGLGRRTYTPPSAAGIQSAFQCYNINSFESVERADASRHLQRSAGAELGGHRRRNGPAQRLQPGQFCARCARRCGAHGRSLGAERAAHQSGALPWVCTCAAAPKTICGIRPEPENGHGGADRAVGAHCQECSRPIATPAQAREICQIGVFYDTVEESLARNGFGSNRNGAQQGFLRKVA